MNHAHITAALALTTLIAAGLAQAGEISVSAPVVNVEPIASPDRLVESCPAKPAGGLGATLRWDLGISCSTHRVPSDEITGYRVFYRWDNRVYSQIMDRNPGAHIALTVSLD
jgi:hypothetical protein